MVHEATHLRYELMPVPKHLSKYVKFIWTLEALPNTGDHFIFRTMANGCTILFCLHKGNIQEARLDSKPGARLRAGVFGLTDNTNRYSLSNDFRMIGLCLYPYSIPALFKTPAASVPSHLTSLSDWLGQDGIDLEEQLNSAGTTRIVCEILISFLRSKSQTAKHEEKLTDAVSSIIGTKGTADIDDLADAYCYSRRTFERKFRAYSGMSPKSYSNIIRFQSSIDTLAAGSRSLTDVAYQNGYYDQSHFTNEFKRFSGFSPKNFTCADPTQDPLWQDFVAFFQFLSWCPPVLCHKE